MGKSIIPIGPFSIAILVYQVGFFWLLLTETVRLSENTFFTYYCNLEGSENRGTHGYPKSSKSLYIYSPLYHLSIETHGDLGYLHFRNPRYCFKRHHVEFYHNGLVFVPRPKSQPLQMPSSAGPCPHSAFWVCQAFFSENEVPQIGCFLYLYIMIYQ